MMIVEREIEIEIETGIAIETNTGMIDIGIIDIEIIEMIQTEEIIEIIEIDMVIEDDEEGTNIMMIMNWMINQ